MICGRHTGPRTVLFHRFPTRIKDLAGPAPESTEEVLTP
jgi:hypothetical protein